MAVRRMVQAGIVPITWMGLLGEWQRDWAREKTLPDLVNLLLEHGGPDGAAARLGLPRTSLISKMKKLGISRPRSGNAPSTMTEESLTGLQSPPAGQL
jgi:hypothetical protein